MLQPKATDGKAEVPIKLTALNPKSKIRNRKSASGEQAGWQRRFWEQQIRDETEFARLVEDIHDNPVRHSLVTGRKIGLTPAFTRDRPGLPHKLTQSRIRISDRTLIEADKCE
jgi:hypothetical protein